MSKYDTSKRRKVGVHERAIVKLRDGKYVKIYYRGKLYNTPYQLPKKVKHDSENPYFNFKTGLLKKGYGEKTYRKANEVILKKLDKINLLIGDAKTEGLDAKTYIENYFNNENRLLKEKVISAKAIFLELFSNWVEAKNNRIRLERIELNSENKMPEFDKNGEPINTKQDYDSNGKKVKYNDIQKNMIANLKHYQVDKKRIYLLNEITYEWMLEYAVWLCTPKLRVQRVYRKTDNIHYETKRTVQMTNSTLRRHLIEFVGFFNFLKKAKVDLAIDIKELSKYAYSLRTNYDKKTSKEDFAYDFLSIREWEIVKKYKVPQERRKEWHTCFELYLFCCYTGLRYSDLVSISPINTKDGELHLDPIKTGKKIERGSVLLPLHPYALKVIEKYHKMNIKKGEDGVDYPFFADYMPQNQRANKTLEKVFKEIPILNAEVRKEKHILKSAPIKFTKKKYECLTWHSSRRSFINILVSKKNVGIDIIQSFSGWSDINTITSYLDKLSKNDERAHGIINDF